MRLASPQRGRHCTPRLTARRVALLATLLATLTLATLTHPPSLDAAPSATPHHPVTTTPAQIIIPPNAIPNASAPLTGTVFAYVRGTLTRVAGAHIGTGQQTFQTDAMGRFTLPSAQRTGFLSVVVPGYNVLRTQPTANAAIFLLEPIAVRAVYLPYSRLGSAATREWALGLARDGLVNAFVIDVKHENGSVLTFVANDTARALGAVRDPAADLDQFIDELGRLGAYRIARVVTFLDTSLALGAPDTALRTADNAIFRDALDLAWTNPFTEATRRHNIEIGVNAARHFDEVQFDYVRLPTDDDIALRFQTTADQRADAIGRFAAEAAQALHAVGAAISIDTFGQTTVATDDQGIGQILEKIAPFLDYYSPMVYPSTWASGWFDLDYPAADPYRVVYESVAAAVARIEDTSATIVRPWLQDFHDYGARKLFYGADQVALQISATATAGGHGFMLWDPSLEYELAPLLTARSLPPTQTDPPTVTAYPSPTPPTQPTSAPPPLAIATPLITPDDRTSTNPTATHPTTRSARVAADYQRLTTIARQVSTLALSSTDSTAPPQWTNSQLRTPIWSAAAEQPTLYLTFDDDPGVPMEILNVLKDKQVAATACIVGLWIHELRDFVQAWDAAGLSFCNHTFNHVPLVDLDAARGLTPPRTAAERQTFIAAVRQEITATQAAFADVLPNTTLLPFFRPPRGLFDEAVVTAAAELGYRTIMWSLDAADWELDRTAQELRDAIVAGAANGDIILLHFGNPATLQALPAIIDGLRARGFAIRGLEDLPSDA